MNVLQVENNCLQFAIEVKADNNIDVLKFVRYFSVQQDIVADVGKSTATWDFYAQSFHLRAAIGSYIVYNADRELEVKSADEFRKRYIVQKEVELVT